MEDQKEDGSKLAQFSGLMINQEVCLATYLMVLEKSIHFFCETDDSQSVIRKLPLGIDEETTLLRVIDLLELATAEIVATLKRGDEPFRITVKTDVSPQRRIMRFTHI